MANPIARVWKAIFFHEGSGYFLLPEVESASPNPPNEGPLGDAGPWGYRWFVRLTRGDSGPTPTFYVAIGVLLGILTLLEVWVFTLDNEFGAAYVPVLLVLAGVKFATVVAFYMHLRFEKNLLTFVFSVGFFIAIAVFVIVLSVQGQLVPDALTAP